MNCGHVKISQTASVKLTNMSFICSILVIFIHLHNGPGPVGTFSWIVWFVVRFAFSTIAVPFFFCASGYLLMKHSNESDWWRRAVRKRFDTLLLPYVIWCHIYVVIFGILPTSESTVNFHDVVWSYLANIGLSFKGPHVLWYIRALLFSY